VVQAGSSSVSDTLRKPAAVAVTKKGTLVYRQQFVCFFSASCIGGEG